MNGSAQEWTEQYGAALREHLAAPREDGLMRAYDLGRRALALDMPIGELAGIHGRAMLLTDMGRSEETAAIAHRASEFLGEALAPYQMVLRGYQEANTLLKQLNDTLEQRVEERSSALREANRHKDEFLALLAHELRNPLAPIRNALQVMKLAGDNPTVVAESRGLMERQLHHMIRLIDDLMDVSRIARGKVELCKERLELASVVGSAVETSRPLIEAGGHRLTISVPPEPVFLDADRVRLAQVIANLLNNSAKYTDQGGQIWITARREGVHAVVSVRDTGVGIPTDMLPKVFEMFTQLDQPPGRAQGGIGIGLSLVRSLVQIHGGSVEARSEGPGRGSEFVIRLPLAVSNRLAEKVTPEPRAAATLSTQRILVVDDNRDAGDSLGMLLRLLGAQVHVVYDGPAALAALEAYRPAVILMDIGMPGMDGYEVARLIRQQPRFQNITLIALTGWGQEKDRARTRDEGFDYHLVKPADINALQALLVSLQGDERDA